MRTVAAIDYGMGNLRSVAQAVMAAAHDSNIHVVITANPDDVHAAERVVLPGQGAMRDCMRELHDSGLMPEVLECHLVSGSFDYLVKARLRAMNDYRELLGTILDKIPVPAQSNSYVVMEEIKESTVLALDR
jgi:DNA-binding Lrp family transcriptional regulator